MSDTLWTDRLIMQPIAMRDHPDLLAHFAAPRVRRYLPGGRSLTGAEVTEVVGSSRREFALTGYGLWTLRLLDPAAAELIGVAGLRRVEDEDASLDGPGPPQPDVEIVYSLDPGRWGHGLALEAVGALLAYAFEVLELDRVLAEIGEGGGVSAAMAERLGMRPYEAGGPMTHYAVHRDDRRRPVGAQALY